METIAQQIAERFIDGQCFEAEDGRQLIDVLEQECVHRSEHGTDVRYELSDESAIVISGGSAWDIGYPGSWRECYCWSSQPHHDDCEASEELVADEEYNAEAFWDEVQGRADTPGEIHALSKGLVYVSRHRAQELLSWCEEIEGFTGGPEHAPTAISVR